MKIPVFLSLFTFSVIVLQYLVRRGAIKHGDPYDDYIDREREANLTVKRNTLNGDLFVVPKTDNLPFIDYDKTPENQKIIKAQSAVMRKSGFKMIKFSNIVTNTDLKLRFGANNLEKITEYEENYNSYIRSLVDWAELLIKRENYRDAEIVLKSAVEFGSDLSRTYISLAKVYSELNKHEQLTDLRNFIEQSDMEMKYKILEHF